MRVHMSRSVRRLSYWSRGKTTGVDWGVGKGEDGGFKRCLNVKSTEAKDGFDKGRGREVRH